MGMLGRQCRTGYTFEWRLSREVRAIRRMISLGEYFEQRWGGKRGLVRHAGWVLLDFGGKLRHLRIVDWSRVDRLVFVCKGNICRSPYAEQRARKLGLCAASFGLEAEIGVPADEVATLVARERGVDLAHTRARRAVNLTLGPRDLVVAMEPWQIRPIESLTYEHGCQITLLGLWSRPACPYIGDPFGRSKAFFARCFATIDSGINAIYAQLHEKHS